MARENLQFATVELKEVRTYNDIVVFDFVDSYKTLTIKTIVSLNWVVKTFNSRIFIKIDDDVIYNLRKVYDAVVWQLDGKYEHKKKVILGHFCNNARVMRPATHKFGVSRDVYPAARYPRYLSGPSYVLTKEAIFSLLNQTR